MKVVLPEPLGPREAITVPGENATSTSSKSFWPEGLAHFLYRDRAGLLAEPAAFCDSRCESGTAGRRTTGHSAAERVLEEPLDPPRRAGYPVPPVTPSHDGSPGPGTYRDRLLLALAFGGTFLSRRAGSVADSLRAELGSPTRRSAPSPPTSPAPSPSPSPRRPRPPVRPAGLPGGRPRRLRRGHCRLRLGRGSGPWSSPGTAAGAGAGTAALLAASLLFDRPRKKDRSPRPVLFLAALAGLSRATSSAASPATTELPGRLPLLWRRHPAPGVPALFATEDAPPGARSLPCPEKGRAPHRRKRSPSSRPARSPPPRPW